MRYAEVENGKVRYVLPAGLADDYKILPPNSIEIGLEDVVEAGMAWDDETKKFVTPPVEAKVEVTGLSVEEKALLYDDIIKSRDDLLLTFKK